MLYNSLISEKLDGNVRIPRVALDVSITLERMDVKATGKRMDIKAKNSLSLWTQ